MLGVRSERHAVVLSRVIDGFDQGLEDVSFLCAWLGALEACSFCYFMVHLEREEC